MHIFEAISLCFAALFILAALLPFSDSPAWWIRILDFPRLHIFVGTSLTLAAVVVSHALGGGLLAPLPLTATILLSGALIVDAWRIFPYLPIAPTQVERVDGDADLRIVTTNVQMQNRDFDRWRSVVLAAEPDVIAAVEVDEWWAERLERLDFEHVLSHPREDTYGLVLLSRFPLEAQAVEHLVEDSVPSLWVSLSVADRALRLVVVHPRPPRPDIQQSSTFRDAELVRVGKTLRDHEGAAVVVGDLNDVAWSHTTRLFQRLSGLLDPRRGRGMYTTFHADHVWGRAPLDHVFHSDHLALCEMRVLEHVGSDHFPMLVALRFAEPVDQADVGPQGDDEAQADEMVDRAEEQLAQESAAQREARKQADR